jgi:hypothetical protein
MPAETNIWEENNGVVESVSLPALASSRADVCIA